MNKKLLLFNIVFYGISFLLIYLGRRNASASLGYGFFIMGFWGITLLALVLLLVKGTIKPQTLADKIAVVTATPVLFILAFSIMMLLRR